MRTAVHETQSNRGLDVRQIQNRKSVSTNYFHLFLLGRLVRARGKTRVFSEIAKPNVRGLRVKGGEICTQENS
jgi:hypothetical protein